ncbi:hypothetical protein [Pseudomonas sp. MAG002Y]|uniref:hypothetical protein n=1 Tax=Pseudomonas sp. MAG002Y TaxID=2678690 RepID=UPI001C60BB90|nr:hypothetical protein [Pseudomonas sp. MAG002Y]MBW5416294.1 hypothetical protein [Pseudomonas sp. MAG002Y]
MTIKYDELRFEIKELISLVRLDEKYASLVAEGLLPIDQQAINCHWQRQNRIEELSRKYGLV